MEQYSIIVSEHIIDEKLQGYELMQKPSSQIDYYGTNGKDVFLQFKNGTSYIYENVPTETIADMKSAESIGSFVFKHLKKLPFRKFDLKLVNSKPQQ
jgi:hypothetical protein